MGELDGGFEVVVRCVSGARGGCVLLVPSESARQWVEEVLAQNGAGAVDVRSEQLEPERWHRRAAAPAVAAVAPLLLGWIGRGG